MAAEIVAGVGAAGAAGAVTLFDYNRKNFVYDRKMRQETEYTIMDFRIKQAELWREDVRDIIGLTAVKMDTYLVVNAVQLGFCVMAFCEGRMAAGTPTWLVGAHTLSLSGAFMYLLMSVWLAMHASVTAKSYEVRLLTQHVRLPMPTWTQLEGARTYCSSFEKLPGRQMFRVPFLQGTQTRVTERNGTGTQAAAGAQQGNNATPGSPRLPPVSAGGAGNPSSDAWGLEAPGDKLYELDGNSRVEPSQLLHLRLVREAMQYWQSYDGFARVSMSIGTNQLVSAVAYYVLGYVLVSNHAVIASWLAVGLFVTINAALVRLDMSLSALEYRVAVFLMGVGPFLSAFSCERWNRHRTTNHESNLFWISILMPIVYIGHATWLMFLLYIAKVSPQRGGALLPTGFRSVMYIDIFGWVRRQRESMEQRRLETLRGAREEGDAIEETSDKGDGVTPPETPGPGAAVGASGWLTTMPLSGIEPGVGPAVEAVQHDRYGRPVPVRPEALPGSAQQLENVEVFEEDFIPTTFVPHAKDVEEQEAYDRDMSVIKPFARPGMVPWRIFCLATVLLTFLWWMVGVAVLFDTSGGNTFFKVEPLLHGAPPPALAKRVEMDESFLQVLPELLGGERIRTSWPHPGVRPRGLSCGGGTGGQRPWAVASTRFGLFAAELPEQDAKLPLTLAEAQGGQAAADKEANGSGKDNDDDDDDDVSKGIVAFEAAPPCFSIEGESLQDVAVQCGESSRGGSRGGRGRVKARAAAPAMSNSSAVPFTAAELEQQCGALVLHRQGQMLSHCPLTNAPAESLSQLETEATPDRLAGSLAVAWLLEADGIGGTPQEEVASLTLGGAWCSNGAVCAYAQTTAQRIVELQTTGSAWYPLKVLQAPTDSPLPGGELGSGLSVLGTDGRFLAVLHPRGRLLEAIDLRGGDDAADRHNADGARQNVGHWRMPEGQQWSAACSAGENLYLMSEGLSPQLWRFPLPAELRDDPDGGAAEALLAEGSEVPGSPSLASKNAAGAILSEGAEVRGPPSLATKEQPPSRTGGEFSMLKLLQPRAPLLLATRRPAATQQEGGGGAAASPVRAAAGADTAGSSAPAAAAAQPSAASTRRFVTLHLGI